MKRHNGWKTASMVAATLAITALAGTSISARVGSTEHVGGAWDRTAAGGVPGHVGSWISAAGRRHGMPRRYEDTTGEALEIAVLSPDYAAQPAAKEAIDLFEARHGERPHGDRRRHEQR